MCVINRILYSVSARRFHNELPRIVGYDVQNSIVVREFILNSHYVYNLEFDSPNQRFVFSCRKTYFRQRLLAVAWNSNTTELQFISINSTSGMVSVLISSISTCQTAYLGVSTFDWSVINFSWKILTFS